MTIGRGYTTVITQIHNLNTAVANGNFRLTWTRNYYQNSKYVAVKTV